MTVHAPRKKFLLSLDLHTHTHHSIDSTTDPQRVALIARRRGLSGVAVTDHNTIRGGVEAAKYAENGIHIIVGSEVKTTIGDMICLFLNEEIRSKDPFEAMSLAKLQGGITILPHPFRSKRSPEAEATFLEAAAKVDAIEVLNGRTSPSSNEKALLLARKLNKPVVAGSDSHFYFETGNCRTLFRVSDSDEELKRAILMGETSVESVSHPFARAAPLYAASFIRLLPRRIRPQT